MTVIARIIDRGNLTVREAEILKHLCEGRMRGEIALRIHRTISTVSKHIESIAEKFGAHSAAEIVAVAVASGIVDIKIVHPQHVLLKCLLIAMIVNPQTMDIRQPPRHGRQSARLIKTTRTETHYRSQSWT